MEPLDHRRAVLISRPPREEPVDGAKRASASSGKPVPLVCDQLELLDARQHERGAGIRHRRDVVPDTRMLAKPAGDALDLNFGTLSLLDGAGRLVAPIDAAPPHGRCPPDDAEGRRSSSRHRTRTARALAPRAAVARAAR